MLSVLWKMGQHATPVSYFRLRLRKMTGSHRVLIEVRLYERVIEKVYAFSVCVCESVSCQQVRLWLTGFSGRSSGCRPGSNIMV